MKKTALVFVFSFMLWAPFFVSADHSTPHTIVTIQAKIKELLARIEALRAVPSGGASVGNSTPRITVATDFPATVEPGEEIWFTWLAEDADKDHLVWSVNWGDGTTWKTACPATLAQKNKENWRYGPRHFWNYRGVYTGTVTVSDCRGGVDSRSFSVTVDMKPEAPVIKTIFGPRALPIGEVGTWTVDAYDPDKGGLSFKVDWADGVEIIKTLETTHRTSAAQSSSMFIHDFKKAGTFAALFTVTDNDGLSTTTKVIISVGDVASQPALQILSPNGGETWLVGSTQTIRWSSRGIPSDHRIASVRVRDAYSGWEGTLATDVVNDGIEDVVAPFPTKAAIPGSYTMEMTTKVGDRTITDLSDNSFTFAASVNRAGSNTAMASILESIRVQLGAISVKLQQLKQSVR